MEELLYQREIHSVFSAGNGEVEVYSWPSQGLARESPPGAAPRRGVRAVALARAGRASLPNGETRLEACDVLNVSGTLEGIEALRKRLAQPERPRCS